MNGTSNTKPFAGFAPGADREFLAEVHRWARQYGWTWNSAWGWINARYASEATLAVEWDTFTRTVTVNRNNGNGIFRPTTYPADTLGQAVDVLHAYGVLPAQLSSAYSAGWHDGYFADVEVETAAEIRDLPAREQVTR